MREDRTGLLLTLAVTVVNTNASCAPVTNASVEIWHCDAAGNYSEYSNLTSSSPRQHQQRRPRRDQPEDERRRVIGALKNDTTLIAHDGWALQCDSSP